MKKKILIGSAVFIVVFLITLFLTFPYQNVVAKAVIAAAAKSGLQISYNDVQAGPFRTVFKELEINDIPIDSLEASYSPLSILSKSATIKLKGLIKADAKVSPTSTEYEAEISESVINSFSGEKAVLSAPLSVKGTGNPSEQSADFTATVSKIEIESPVGKLPFENIQADITIKGNDITINKLTSRDDMNLDLKGLLKVNPKNLERSIVNIKGTADVFGQQKQITLVGRIDNIQPSIK